MDTCKRCGTPITSDLPEGICARCMLGVAIGGDGSITVDTVAAKAASPSPTATRLGPIRLVRLIGKGGMGEVWLGRHELLGRDVAVKLLLGVVQHAKDPAFKTFIAGARVAASLEHPGLNKIFDADVADGVPYLVLELLDGPNLAELVERSGPLDLSTARAVVEAVCEAVAELNQHDLVHRDLKPSNLVLTTDGRVVVTDFGLACARPPAGLGNDALAGTPAYMAPEMFDGKISARTDVYALGMTAYHLLCGRPPFAGDFHEQRRQHREVALDPQPLQSAGVPPAVIQVIVRATSKEVLFRPKTAWHVLVALRAAFDEAGIQRATTDKLAHTLKDRTGHLNAAPRKASSNPSSGSSTTAIAELAARKRDLRAATAPSAPSPLMPPIWAVPGQEAEARGGSEIPTGSRSTARPIAPALAGGRPERRRIWIARLIASAVGALATLLFYMIYWWAYSRLATWIDAGTRETFAGKTVPFVTLSVSSPIWARLLLMDAPLVVMWMIAIGVSTPLYRIVRGKPFPWKTENTHCGWCQHELRGITTPVCSECGHRIGDQGPDEQGFYPTNRRSPRRMTGWIAYPLFFLLVYVVVRFLASLVTFGITLGLGITVAGRASPEVNPGRTFVPDFIMLFISLAITLAFYEGILQFDLTHSGRAWCRVCKEELKDLTEPICPACHTKI
jgi:serine/threonine protein kinase